MTACWVDSTCELLARLDRDRPAIAAAFGAGQDPGPLTWVNPALSDPHHGRRRVSALGFASGLRIVYKPRDLSLDRAFNDLLGWLAARGLRPAPRALQVLEREGYGWVEFASTEPLRSSDEARAYFEQAGSLICIAHVFRGRDFHMDNLVATRQGPVLVDLEPLLQPASVANGADRVQSDEETPPAAAGESCLATGLLHLYELGPDGGMFDVGGLSGTGVGTRTIPRRVWRNQRTNALRFDEELAFATAGLNLARRDGRIEQPDSHARDILAGFTRAYRVIARERPALLAAGGPLSGLVSCRVRVIPRPTNQYALLSTALAAPRYQDDGMRHGAALDILLRPFGRHSKRPAIWPALAEERRALESLDIPYFWVRADDTDVRAGGHMVAANYFATSGLSAVRERLGALCERDLDAECGILARAMSESPRSRFSATFPAAGAADQSDTRSQPFVDAAVWIGRELLARARDVPGGIGWPRLDRHEPDIVGPHALYDGSSGVALFFGALHRCTGESRWADVARQTAAPIHDAIRRGEFAAWRGDAIGIGDGLGSIVYGLVCLSRLIEDDAALDRAFDIATLIASRIADNRRDDVLSGAAGALIALLVLHRVRPDTRLVQWASDLGAQLVARQQRVGPVSTWPAADGQPLLGFAHGAAGIAFALSRLHAEAASAPVAEAAARGMRFVGERFVPAQGNWPVSASSTGVAGTAFMTAWCHGAPGIALAIAATDGCVDGARAELRAALTTSATWRPGRADHLCCGTLGRADILLTLGRRLVLEESIGAARALGLRVTDRARQAGHFRLSVPGPEYRVFEPGFFRGLSGIGYALLRLGTETSLPSILACESPVP